MAPLSRWLLPCTLAAVFVVACAVPQMRIDPGLAASSPTLPVSGRNGWMVDQVLRFGPYRAGPVNRGWTKGYDYPFFVRFSGAREKLQFAVVDGEGREALVHCAGKLREQDLRIFRDYFAVNIGTTDSFTGTVSLDGLDPFDFYIENLNTQQNLGYRELSGAVRGNGETLQIRPVWQLESGQRWLGNQAIGVEFFRGDRVLGAVETVNQGRVWIEEALGSDERLLVASLAAALLLRSELAEHNDNL